MLEPGAMIAGKLRVERVLGKGGMGTVVVATHVGLDQRVAIKILHPELANQTDVKRAGLVVMHRLRLDAALDELPDGLS